MAGASGSAAPPKRLSTAAQFFDEENKDAPELPKKSTYDKVVDLLNQASLLPSDVDKVGHLKQVQELVIHKDPALLDNFLDEVIAFQNDRSTDVKKCVIGFMEEACKTDQECLVRVVPCIHHLLQDDNVNVQKKVILAFSAIYRCSLLWVSKAKTPTPEMEAIWDRVNQIKATLLELLESDNDGVRTHVVKMLEGLTLALSKRTPDSETPKNQKSDMSLDQVTENNRLVRIKKLEAEGQNFFMQLVQFQGSPHISSINLMTVMGALSNIAKQRPGFFDQVVQSFEALHVNLPPTLAKSQVSSVRKNLKMQMMGLLRHVSSIDFIPQITTLLTDLGASQSEINKAMPKDAESRKRKLEEPSTSSKKARIDPVPDPEADDYDIGMTPWTDRTKKQPTATQRQTAIDITAEELLPRLSVQHVADLVLLSMVMLPDQMPAQFQATYTPIAAAGTESQIKHISRLLATQLTMAGMGKGVGELKLQAMRKTELTDPSATPARDDGGTSPNKLIQTLVGGSTGEPEEDSFKKVQEFISPVVPAPRKGGVRQFKLESVTKPLKSENLDTMTVAIFNRILQSDRAASASHVQGARIKVLVSLTSQFGGRLRDMLEEYIFSDLRNRWDIAFSWLYQEYVYCQGFHTNPIPGKVVDMASYDECLTRLLKTISEIPDQKDGLFHRLILQAPVITDNAMQMIRRYCSVPDRAETGMKALRDLIEMRPKKRLDFLDVMLTFTSSDRPEIRDTSIQTAQKLYENVQLRPSIETYALKQLKLLLAEKPDIDPKRALEEGKPMVWTEENIKTHLYLYLGLLPSNHALIHELANIYTATSADIKRTILRMLEAPVKGMGMDSPELLTLVENCPKGSETLVMRVIHILTDKAAPSPELVHRIRDLYQKRVPDVRFLIPVLNGLSKKEVTSALPKLIKLNPMVVKEVFNRLMGAHISANASYQSPLTPDELLVALHNIDPNKCDMKTIIKAANLCLSEKSIYTQEVLAIVMQRLMEQSPLPTLLMRTVIQSLAMYPRLIGFVVNILHRLLTKQVWSQPKVWEGFVKCCQRTKPQSFQVLLKLAPPQLANVFQVSPELRLPLLQHVQSFSQHQLACVPPEIMRVLETEPVPLKPGDTPTPTPERPPEVIPPTPSSGTALRSIQEQLPPMGQIQTISTVAKGRVVEPLRQLQSDNEVQITGEVINVKQEPASPPPPPPGTVTIKQERDDEDYPSSSRSRDRPSSRDDSRSSSRRSDDADRSRRSDDRGRRSDDDRSRRSDDKERSSSTSRRSEDDRSRRSDDRDRSSRADDRDRSSRRSEDERSSSRRPEDDRRTDDRSSSRRSDDERSSKRSDDERSSKRSRSVRSESTDKSALVIQIKQEPMDTEPVPSSTEPLVVHDDEEKTDERAAGNVTPTMDESTADDLPESGGKQRSTRSKAAPTRRSTRSKR